MTQVRPKIETFIFAMISTILIGFTAMFTTAFAEEVNTKKVDEIQARTVSAYESASGSRNANDINSSAGVADVSIDDANNWVDRKGSDVVHFLQVFIQPFAIVMFIISCIVTLVGALGSKGWVAKGIITIGISILMYTAVMFAPELLSFFSRWLAS